MLEAIPAFHSIDHDEEKFVDVSRGNEIDIQSPSKLDNESFIQRVGSINQNGTIELSDMVEIEGKYFRCDADIKNL